MTSPTRRGWLRYAAPALLTLFFLLVVTAAATKSATYDEAVHIHAGWRILTAGDFSTNHEHPPLMKVLAALPLTAMNVRPPATALKSEIDQWAVSHDFVHHANDGDRVLRAARLPIALLAVLLAWALHRHASAALGEEAGLMALALLVFEPNMLAHAGLVTTDLGNTAMTFLTLVSFVAALRSGRLAAVAAAGGLFGLALLTKFTAVLLIPILMVAAVLVLVFEPKTPGGWRRAAVSLAIVAIVGLVVLNAGYGFGGTFSTLRDFAPESRAFRDRAAGPLGVLPLPLPREYVRGFDHAEAGGQLWWSYLLGETSQTGWRHYHLVALAVKTPLPLLLMALAGLILWPRAAGAGRHAPRTVDLLLPAVPVLAYLAAFTLSSNIKNIGLRYILPVYPFLCLLGAVAARARLTKAWVPWVLVGWQALAVAWIYPDFLTFFNLTVGGPSRGREVLLDSNLDWGQDLKGLGRWIRDNRVDRIYVDYFGRACLRQEGVASTPDFEGGLIAVSATHLKGVYAADKDRYRFLWDLPPRAVIGRSIFIYDVPRPPGWTPHPGSSEGR
jgi:4-amino-4-deoxy-L-arabinose transferase-like glycosyltransferase